MTSEAFDNPQPKETLTPSHYNRGPVETVVALTCLAAGYSGIYAFYVANIGKYLARAPFKGTYVEDLLKARHYLTMLIEETT